MISGGRLILGVASGDRPHEYPALNLRFDDRGVHFRESLKSIRSVAGSRAQFESSYGSPSGGTDLLQSPPAIVCRCLLRAAASRIYIGLRAAVTAG